MGRLRLLGTLGAATLVALAIVAPVGAAGPGAMRVNAPTAKQTTDTPFEVTVEITRADVTWAGYNDEMAYDKTVLKVNSVTMAGIAGCNDASWANPETDPVILAACVFQSTKATGLTEKIQFQCLKDGASTLHLITKQEDKINGTELFDESGDDIATDTTDAQVTCGAGGALATVAIPTNPSESDILTAIAQGPYTAVPGGTPQAGQTSGAQAGTTPSGGETGAPNAGSGVPSGTAAVATASAIAKTEGPAIATRTAQAGTVAPSSSSSGGSSKKGWVIGGIIAGIIVVGGGAGAGYWWMRRRATAV